jgi:Cof subfamily protein (haloacid dehalogenase superfamily)
MKLKDVLKNIKLIVSDIDGTLLRDDGTVGPETRELISQLSEEGVIFSLATGRLHSAVTEIAKDISLNGPVISLDGSLIKTFPDNKVIFENFIKHKSVERAIRYAEENLFNIVLCHADEIYYTEHNTMIPELLSKYGAIYREVNSYDDYIRGTLEIVFTSDMKYALSKIAERFSFPYTMGCSVSFFRSLRRENIYYLEVRRSGCNKGTGLKRILKHLKIKPMNAAVLGDWYNDISLFKTRALKVAVANAIPELLNKADIVTTKTNNEEGAAEFLKMILKAKKG